MALAGIVSSIEELRSSDSVEPAEIFRIAALAFGAQGASSFEKVSFFVLGSVFNGAAERMENGSFNEDVSALASSALEVLSQKEWATGNAALVAFIDLFSPKRFVH